MHNDGPLNHLIKMLSTLPGLGNRSAQRIALYLLNKRQSLMLPMADALQKAAEEIRECTICGNLDMTSPCRICRDHRRDSSSICVVANVSDLWAIERTEFYKGSYHVLGGLLSALDGIGPNDLRITQLTNRITNEEIKEVILALSATVDGQSTAHYISDQLQAGDNSRLKITRLAHGVPVGGELDYLDEGTITTALKARSST